ncbi:hypothetical protein HMPREF1870_02135 [Bacteroidales bacterium KA00344]|nr:hypothetical protein HMPREF1870_02135 [Bacteroidales bacterium KA00344]
MTDMAKIQIKTEKLILLKGNSIFNGEFDFESSIFKLVDPIY